MQAPEWSAEKSIYKSARHYVGGLTVSAPVRPSNGLGGIPVPTLQRCGGVFGKRCNELNEDCCFGVCVPIGTPENCARCGNACGYGEICCLNSFSNWYQCTRRGEENCRGCGVGCARGACCPPNPLGGSNDWYCADLPNDPLNCGRCGRTCPFPVTDGCCYNDARKSFDCTPLNTRANCGACGRSCPTPSTEWDCCLKRRDSIGGRVVREVWDCTDLTRDPNCGACGNNCATRGKICQNLQCVCPPGTTSCGQTCCPAGQACCNGACCPQGQTCCNNRCVDLMNDPQNCGVCGNDCRGGICRNGICNCAPGTTFCRGGCCGGTHPNCCQNCILPNVCCPSGLPVGCAPTPG